MAIDDNGHMGIGTSTIPDDAKLTIDDSLPRISFRQNSVSADNGDLGTLYFGGLYNSTTYGKGAQISAEAEGLWSASNKAANLYFKTEAANGGLLNRMVITSAGNVGIGTTSPSHKLDVVGTAGLSTGTAWTNTSDIRLKNIDGDYNYGLNEILQLHTVRFHYKENNIRNMPSDIPLIGFIAQEVQPIFPEAINEGEDGYLDFNIHPISVAMVNAVQELDKENKVLKQELSLLKSYLCAKDHQAVFCN